MVATPGPRKTPSVPSQPQTSITSSPTPTGGRVISRTPIPLFSRERIFMFGKEGTGKTNSWMKIAEHFPDVPFHAIDTDDSVQRLLETDYPELTNVTPYPAQTWEDFEAAVDEAILRINEYVTEHPPQRREDYPWLVVDFADATWDMAQSYFTEQVFNKGIDEYFLQARKTIRGGQLQPLEGWTDWQVINKLFQARWRIIALSAGPFHVYITAKAKKAEGIEGKSLYRLLKMMPEGEKRMGYRVHTILMAAVDDKGWYLSSAKDRGRELLSEARVPDFVVSYLLKVAKWEL